MSSYYQQDLSIVGGFVQNRRFKLTNEETNIRFMAQSWSALAQMAPGMENKVQMKNIRAEPTAAGLRVLWSRAFRVGIKQHQLNFCTRHRDLKPFNSDLFKNQAVNQRAP